MAKVGDKYIIEIDDILSGCEGLNEYSRLYRAKGFKTLVFDEYGLEKLEKYEPKTIVKWVGGKDEGIIYNDGWRNGLKDAWEVAKKLINANWEFFSEYSEAVGKSAYENAKEIINNSTYDEIVEKIKSYEEQKKAEKEIKVGDEVANERENCAVVLRTNSTEKLLLLWDDGTTTEDNAKYWKKTGRHFPQIAEVLKQIGSGGHED